MRRTPDLELRLRQERAVWRSGQLRQELVQQSTVLVAPLVQADRAKQGLLWLRKHPVCLAVLVATVVALKPRNVLSYIGRAWSLWRSVRRFFH
ncbi:MAG: YqjK family protein [Rhodoferax sp.]|nr:YqjK family protein [Rhodoferax sp.]